MSVLSPRRQELFHQREAMYAELESVLEEEADPLAAYDNLVKWTLQNYANHSDSGLLGLLEETVRRFKDDMRYKSGDLRYVKLWILFANHVDKPVMIYAYMMEKGIGKPYSLFFEEYAEALERDGRFVEAETVMTLGIRTQAKPLKHLQQFQEDYYTRRASRKLLPKKIPPFREGTCSADLKAILVDPLRNIAPRRPGSTPPSTLSVLSYTGQHDISMTTTQDIHSVVPARPNPYAHLNAPPAPGKKPEKLRFDLTLLLEPDGTEYSFDEARARHLGLLGKKWPPPPPPNAAASSSKAAPGHENIPREGSVKVDFNDNGSKNARPARRQSVTVTFNTKQALEDVFDMYNSPVKEEPDVEEAVQIKPRPIETPGLLQTLGPTASRPSAFQDENAGVATTKPRAFQPYVDQRRENITPSAPKFKANTDKTPGSNAFTPNLARKALVAKDLAAPVPVFKVVRPQQVPLISEQRPQADEVKGDTTGIDVFGGDDVTADEFTEEMTHPPPPPAPPRSFVPFVDGDTGNAALPAPPSKSSSSLSTSTSKILKFQVHRDENTPQPSARCPMGGERTPVQLAFKPMHQEEQTPLDEDEASQVDDDIEDEYQEVEDRQRFARSDRFANFDVMTPITERTFEFTTSTRAIGTPGSDDISLLDRGFVASDAQDVDERTAAELQEEGTIDQEQWTAEDAKDRGPVALLGPEITNAAGDESGSNEAFSSFEQLRAPFRVSDGFTIEPNHSNLLSSAIVVDSTSTNISQALRGQPGIELPNPCNPSDPDIMSMIISLLPAEPDHQDLQHRVADHLGTMHRFAEKRARRKSGASSSSRVSDGTDGLRLDLNEDVFDVFDKLGEGGFGAVFMARDLAKSRPQGDEDEGEDDSLVAVKAVRPTNLWESYMLRRIISAAPEDLRRSIIRPHRLYAFKDESFLILDLCQQGTLLEIVNRATEIGIGQLGGGLDELLAMFFTVELLRVLQGLHDRGFIHGDLKIDNCLIRLEDIPGGVSAWSSEYNPSGEGGWASKGIKLIDFGRTIDTNLYPAGQTFVADWKTDARDCLEMRQGRPWTFQTDYAGLASIIYCMLFGKYIEPIEVDSPEGERKVKPSQPMRRYWQADLWNRLFDALLNPCQLRPDGSLPVTNELVALRIEVEKWLQTNCNKAGKNLKSMLKKIEIVSLRRISPK